MKKTFGRSSILILALVCVTLLLFFIYNRSLDERRVIGKRTIGEFIIHTHPSTNPGFCSNDEILLASSSRHVATVGLCEDNLEDISQYGDWVYGTTTQGRTFRINLVLGKLEILKASGARGFGGGITLY